jgi:hypothetical protein
MCLYWIRVVVCNLFYASVFLIIWLLNLLIQYIDQYFYLLGEVRDLCED